MLDLELKRVKRAKKYTRGMMYARGFFVCHMLEDTWRPTTAPKVPGETCIPDGIYNVEITVSPKFSKLAGREVKLPLLWNVVTPEGRRLVVSADGKHVFEGVRLHSGITVAHTEGCPLTGLSYVDLDGGERCELRDSRAAYAKLERLIAEEQAREGGKIQLKISSEG